MPGNTERTVDLAGKLKLNENETFVLRRFDEALDLYRRLPDLTEAELLTISATDRIMLDMLAARTVRRR